jgi:hypothetical protein
MAMQSRTKGSGAKPEHKRTPREAEAVDKFRRGRAQGAPRLKVVKGGDRPSLAPDHPDKTIGFILLMEALGTTDLDFLNPLLGQLGDVASDEQGINFMLSVIKGIKPRDQLEAMLAAQMAAVHNATMTFARRLAHVDTILQSEIAERTLNKSLIAFPKENLRYGSQN